MTISKDTLANCIAVAAASPLMRFNWANRGTAPAGYIKGMAAAYALLFDALRSGDPIAEAIAAPASNRSEDVLVHYEMQLHGAGLQSEPPLRQVMTILLGLGMRESSGQYFCGRDREAKPEEPISATTETGLFQQSFNLFGFSPLLKTVPVPADDGLLSIFREGVSPDADNLKNWGQPGPGLNFQRDCKAKPYYAVVTAALGMRFTGGPHGHWGPLRAHAAQVLPAANALFDGIERLLLAAGSGPQASPNAPGATPAAPQPENGAGAAPVVAPGPAPGPISTETLRRGSKGPLVGSLQRLLRVTGAVLEDDGEFGPITEQAVKRLQGSAGLPITGVVDEATGAALQVAARPPKLPSVVGVAPHLATMRAITGLREIPGDADSPIIMSWNKVIADAFPEMAAYSREYTHDAVPWCGQCVAYCFAENKLRPPFGSTDVKRYLWAAAWGIETPDLLILPKGVFFPGAVMVFTRAGGGHVSLYEGEDEDFFHIRGGNQADMVNVTRMSKEQFTCASWPRSLPVPAINRIRMDPSHNPISTKVT